MPSIDFDIIPEVIVPKLLLMTWQENKLVRTVATSYAAETLHWAETGIFAAGSDLGDKTATLWNPQTAGAVKTVTSTVVIGPTAMSQDGKTLAVYHPPQGLSVWTLAKT